MAAENVHSGIEAWCIRRGPSLLPLNTVSDFAAPNFDGLRVVAFQTRRAQAMRALIENCGGVATLVPCVREVPHLDPKILATLERALRDGKMDTTVFTTEHGARLLLENLAGARTLLSSTRIVARSPLVAATLEQLLCPVQSIALEPHTWREVLSLLEQTTLRGKRIALQEAGLPNRAFARALQSRGAQLLRVPVYHWALPEDLAPLTRALNDLAEARFDVALFSAATQVWHLFKLAYRKGMEDELRAGLRRVLVASLGPVTSEALREFEIEPDLQASCFNLETLVAETALFARATRKGNGM